MGIYDGGSGPGPRIPDEARVTAYVVVVSLLAAGLACLAAWAIYGWVPR